MPDWTKEQEQVIASRGQNLLVAAAAGSGKTAVLVERIIRMLTEPGSRLDIDRLLVVTYTNAAAAEMKDKILRALEKALAERPDDLHLASQLTRIHSAAISTIHSFCLSVIRSHFHEIDLDPAFRTGDEGEMKLLQRDTVQALMDECYELLAEGIHPEWLKEDADPEMCIRAMETGRKDTSIEDAIIKLYLEACGYVSEREWLQTCRSVYEDPEKEPAWKAQFRMRILQEFEDLVEDFRHLQELNIEKNGPENYTEFFKTDLELLDQIRRELQDAELFLIPGILEKISFVTFRAPGKKLVYDPNTAEFIKNKRNKLKDEIAGFSKQYFYAAPQVMEEDLKRSGNTIRVLIDLTLEFAKRFREAKKKRNLIDYSDMEHYALDILTEVKDGVRVPSAAAAEYRDHFAEVIIDEYQDSSFIQEALLESVSGVSEGRNNRFMVGDVKQSIYGFRQSRPEIFQEKYEHYTDPAAAGCSRINLTRNFRSDARILDCANDVFRHIMRREVGGVDYTGEQELVYGRGAFMPALKEMPRSEVLLVDTGKEDLSDADANAKEAEFIAIADRIKKMIDDPQELIHDPRTGQLRRVQYGDIVILLRTMKEWADTGVKVLTERGIPAFTESRSGYFEAKEIRLITDYLRILDNPRQDIPMAAILHSPIGGFSADDLAAIRGAYPKIPFCMAVQAYAEGEESLSEEENSRRQRLLSFLSMTRTHREMVLYTPLHQLIRQILKDTGYGVYMSAMSGGARREANMEMLIQRARNYEAVSYRGIFHFLRYLDELEDKEVDFGEANITEESDSVRILSDHKSKGLEFPVVFVAGLGSRLRKRDRDGSIVLHAAYKMAAESLDPETRIKSTTLHRTLILKEKEYDIVGEEIRVIYVAMTRARERMILTGGVKDPENKLTLWKNCRWEGERLSVRDLMKATTSLDLVMPAILKEEQDFLVTPVSLKELEEHEIAQTTGEYLTEEEIRRLDTAQVYDEALLLKLKETEKYVYPYEDILHYPAKVSVSELKMKHIEENNESDPLIADRTPVPLIPKFLQEEEDEVKGTDRGTAYHRFLELYDYTEEGEIDESHVRAQMARQVEQGLLTARAADLIRPSAMVTFLNSPIGARMRAAAAAGTLKREQMFMLGIPGDELYGPSAGEETYLIQGIIDACFEEDGEFVIVDYKTDRVSSGEELREHYATQLNYYGQALSRLTQKPVKEKLLYSFALKDTVSV